MAFQYLPTLSLLHGKNTQRQRFYARIAHRRNPSEISQFLLEGLSVYLPMILR